MTDSQRQPTFTLKIEATDGSNVNLGELDVLPEKEIGMTEENGQNVEEMAGVYVVEEEYNESQVAHDRLANEASSQSRKTIFTWNEEQTRLMLTLYRDKVRHIGTLNKYKSKKQMFESISDDIKNQLGVSFTAMQIENRFKNIARKHRDLLKNRRASDNPLYNEEMLQIAAVDVSIEPDIVLTPKLLKRTSRVGMTRSVPKRPKYFDEPGPSADNSDEAVATPTRGRDDDVTAHLLAAYRRETDRKVRRDKEKALQHREKMEKLDQLINVLIEISDKIG
ncbi:uncharacterized protein LOC128732503 [Sabethes cyaneus]|uniref:uncharacterized protein LOC128732503 n=1 Tax=Sabethes cyaneus TaxID=53552 RepID=UPI00237D8A54|nr:uncharacterized protein LOC128732503 [Sabethes cyaneus]